MRYMLSIAALLLSACTGLRARAYGGIQQTTLQGGVALDNSAGSLSLGANRADIDADLGLDDREYSPYVRAEIGLPIGSATVSGFRFNQTGAGTLTGGQFGDIPAGTQVTSFMKFTNVKVAAHYDLFDIGVLRLSPGVGVDFIDFDLQVTELGTSNYERVDNRVYVPMLFAQAEANLGILAATLDVGYMQASLNNAKGSYLDVEALIRVSPSPFVEIFAGYRLIELDARGVADDRRYDADLTLHGWVLGGGVTF